MLYRIIIIDDESTINDGFAKFFPWEKLGFCVIGQFDNAGDAIKFLQKNEVDVIISDIVMPEFSGIDLAREVSLMDIRPRPLVVLFSAYDEFKFAQQAIEYGCSNYILKSSGYNELLTNFTRLKKKLDAERNPQATVAVNENKIIQQIKNYVRENPASANLESAAATVYLSTSYTSRYFKQKTGMNFMDYVMQNRMEMAARLLLDLRYKIYDVSELTGYTNPYNFTRSFKRFYGITPKYYRFEKLGRVLPGDEEESI